jgi:succinylglutamate desuccinylase
MYEDMRKLNGDEPGPTSIVLAGVHGDERCCVDALLSVMADVGNIRGRVFYGFGNPRAIGSGVRYVEANLNRLFRDPGSLTYGESRSYEYSRSTFLKKYLDQADALLDLHASFTENSSPFLICEANSKGITEYLPISMVVSGFDSVEPGGTDYYMNSIGKIGICAECGYLGDPDSEKVARRTITAFLGARGHMATPVVTRSQKHIRMCSIYLTRTDHFVLRKSFSDFEEIRNGEIIGIDGDATIRAEKDGVILFARNRNKTGEEAYLLGEITNSPT